MGMSIFTPGGELEVPTRGGGGTSVELLARIALLEQKVQDLQNAVPNKLDAGKVTMALDVTQEGYAVDARQMNANTPGTMSNRLQVVEKGQFVQKGVEYHFNAPTIVIDGYCQGCSIPAPRGSYAVQIKSVDFWGYRQLTSEEIEQITIMRQDGYFSFEISSEKELRKTINRTCVLSFTYVFI